jgi:hypothetical protein
MSTCRRLPTKYMHSNVDSNISSLLVYLAICPFYGFICDTYIAKDADSFASSCFDGLSEREALH